MDITLVLQLLFLLGLANGAPVLLNKLLGRRWSHPLDAGLSLIDGQPVLGSSKTIRGILSSLLVTTVGAPLIGLDWKIGIVVATAAMAGDLFSSFLKRRMRMPAGSRATGLDQIPESLFPLLACLPMLSLTALDIVVVLVVFFFGEVLLSLVFFKLHLRERPY